MQDNDIYLKSKKVWDDNIKLFPRKLQYPDENLVRLFSGRYIDIPKPPAKVMEHGFGHATNLVFFASKGYECAGCEISEPFLQEARELFKDVDEPVDLRLIKGLDIPYDNETFDLVVSWDVIHYLGNRKAVLKVINELYRVLKPNGVLLLSTLHPDSSFSDRMKSIGDSSYVIEKESKYDNRKGLILFMAKSSDELVSLFKRFSKVKTGNACFDLFDYSERTAWFLVYAVKEQWQKQL